MSLLVYNRSGSDVILAGVGITVPASTLPPLPGPPVNVSTELKDLTNDQWAAIEVQRAAAPLEFVWIGLPVYATPGLEVTDVYGNTNITLTSNDNSVTIVNGDLSVNFPAITSNDGSVTVVGDDLSVNFPTITSNDGSVTVVANDLSTTFGTSIAEVAIATTAGVLAEAARVDHAHILGEAALAAIYKAIYGAIYSDGIDGDADLDGTNTVSWATKSGSTYTVTRVAYLYNLRIRNGVELKTANFHGPYGKGRLTIDVGGVISNDGAPASGATGGASTAAGTLFANSNGGTGTNTTGGSGGVGGGVAMPPTAGKYQGGSGGAGTSAAGSGGTVTPAAATRGNMHGGPQLLGGFAHSQLSASQFSFGTGGGAGGGDGSANPGGGGGAAGGAVELGWGEIVNNGTIRAKGGNGAAGTANNCGGGGGGGGGKVGINCGVYSGTGTISVIPGNAGAGGGGAGLPGNAGLEGNIVRSYPMSA